MEIFCFPCEISIVHPFTQVMNAWHVYIDYTNNEYNGGFLLFFFVQLSPIFVKNIIISVRCVFIHLFNINIVNSLSILEVITSFICCRCWRVAIKCQTRQQLQNTVYQICEAFVDPRFLCNSLVLGCMQMDRVHFLVSACAVMHIAHKLAFRIPSIPEVWAFGFSWLGKRRFPITHLTSLHLA